MGSQIPTFYHSGVTASITHWGQIAAGCGTPLCGDLWACRPPAAPAIPAQGSADWVFSPAPAPLAWRSGSRADWLPKHTVRADEQGWGHLHTFRLNHTGQGRVMHGRLGMSERICHTFVASLVFCLPSAHLLFPFVYLSCVGLSLLETIHTQARTPSLTHTHTYNTHIKPLNWGCGVFRKLFQPLEYRRSTYLFIRQGVTFFKSTHTYSASTYTRCTVNKHTTTSVCSHRDDWRSDLYNVGVRPCIRNVCIQKDVGNEFVTLRSTFNCLTHTTHMLYDAVPVGRTHCSSWWGWSGGSVAAAWDSPQLWKVHHFQYEKHYHRKKLTLDTKVQN